MGHRFVFRGTHGIDSSYEGRRVDVCWRPGRIAEDLAGKPREEFPRALFEKALCPRTNAGVTDRPQVAHAGSTSGRVTETLRLPSSVRVTGRTNIGPDKRFACSSTSNIRRFARFASSMVEAGSARIECRRQIMFPSAAFSKRIALASFRKLRKLAGVARKTIMVWFGRGFVLTFSIWREQSESTKIAIRLQ